MAIKLKERGIPFVVLEKAQGVGGVWRDNAYPGSACDIPSHLYSYSFEPHPGWSRKYSPQHEIVGYVDHCARRYGLYEHMRFGTEVVATTWDEDACRWRVELDDGEVVDAQHLVMATGQLSRPSIPAIPGLEDFEGAAFHSARWDHDYDMTGKRVAVLGTGASAIQFVPEVAKRAAKVEVFQRSAPYVLAKPDRAYAPREHRLFRRLPPLQAASRAHKWLRHELRFVLFTRPRMATLYEAWFKACLRFRVPDRELRAKCTPDYRMGCKRILISNDWYPALRRPNVDVVTDSVTRIERDRLVDAAGREHPADAIVLGTGFKASEFLSPITVTGLGGRRIDEAWRDGAEAYLGVTVAGFPNLFLLYGPNTNLGHSSIVLMIEGQTDYALAAMRHAERSGAEGLHVRPEAQDAFNRRIQDQLQNVVWAQGCTSWYLAPGGKSTNNWPGFTLEYMHRTRRFAPAAYELVRARQREPAAV